MANIKSAQKRVLVNEKKNAANKAAKTAVKTEIKKGMAAVAEGKDVAAAVSATCVKVDKAAAKGLMHKNTAARRKSALMKKANETKNA